MKDQARIAVLVSGGGTNLGAILKAQDKGQIPSGKVALVVSDRQGAYALERARRHGVPGVVLSKKELGGAGFEKALLETLSREKIDLIVLAGFLTILSADFTKRYPERIINVHPSLIPSFCGAGFYGLKVHEAALAKGVKVTGATVHFVNEIPDGGRIILQKAVAVREGDTPEILQKRVMRLAEWVILPRAVELVAKQLVEERKKV